ncbi:MAG: exodeoxyribonuclease V subunit gamma, partial [Planctomycetes bacterium]|nr:exodeoxyribonuclease V subunit gamma [Planctomycetota bacterium]
MAVRFILGPSGCGKTTYCVNSIVRALADGGGEEDLLLLVPEQATYQAERAILGDERIAGYSRLNVLSFDRLEFLLMGAGAGRAQITRLGQEMIIHRILRTIEGRLSIFASAARTPGLAARLTGIIVEMHECALTSADIRELADNLKQARPGSLTAMKFADIAEVFESYLEFIGSADNEFINPDIQLTCACDKVKDADFLRGARIWVDGFSGFTIQQQQLLARMLKVASESHIALCLDPAAIDVRGPDAKILDPLSLFGETEKTYADLFEMVRQCKVPIAEPVVLTEPMRFSGSKDLRHVQRNLFASRPAPPINASGDIQIFAAANRRTEAGYVAKEILRLVRDRGYRFRDIAVIASDISGYQHYIEATFADHGIPLFIDRPRPLTGHPVVELIGSAIAAVANNFSSADIFACLKTGLMPAGQDEIDVLENYCLAFGIDHGDWVSDGDWSFEPAKDKRYDEKRVSEIRRRVIAPLRELRRRASGEDGDKLIGAGAFVGGLWGFLEGLNIREELSKWVEQNPSEDNEHLQFYDKLVSVFDELVDIFAGESMRLADYASVLNSAFSQLTLAFIPPKLDQVLVGSIERSRHPNLKAVFLIGATQKHFPVPVSFDSILTDDDRAAAETGDVMLSGRTDQQLAQRQYLAYIAFTRPSERLYITWPASDDGSGALPSQFINNLRSCFVDLAAGTQDMP